MLPDALQVHLGVAVGVADLHPQTERPAGRLDAAGDLQT
jgi:hypothetical protein